MARLPFQSTHPVWDATLCHCRGSPRGGVSIHASRVGCDWGWRSAESRQIRVSIHASRVGCDSNRTAALNLHPGFNPRIPCGMRRRFFLSELFSKKFQSTHPVWDATAWKLAVDGQWCRCCFASTCSLYCCFQVRCFYSSDVNVQHSRIYVNRRPPGNFL